MIDPETVTDYGRDAPRLEEFLFYAILVANRGADVAARVLDEILRGRCGWDSRGSPAESLCDHYLARARPGRGQPFRVERLAADLRQSGMGLNNQKAATLAALALRCTSPVAPFPLDTAAPADLEWIPGVGMKTSRFFILHSQAGVRLACLDRHALRWLQAQRDGDFKRAVEAGEGSAELARVVRRATLKRRVPRDTPGSPPRYAAIERYYLALADFYGRTPAELDLAIWREARVRKKPVAV